MEKMKIRDFILRLIAYFIIGAVIPFVFLAVKFNLFKPTQKESLSFGGWGIVAIIFIAVFFLRMLKQIRAGMTYSMATQIIDATTKILIPLLIAIICVYFAGTFQKELLQFLIVVFLCEIPASIVNPLPRWGYENHIEVGSSIIKNVVSTIKGGGKNG